ncbi:TetR family transcriptional regulator, partial [Kitasatospora sp. NPDC093558]|uniref:TetR family transcriptional regulator n=1 Tax=Kitasatospora sp. NPDC093558 TaxID=3155201 RepID=UPI00341DA95F
MSAEPEATRGATEAAPLRRRGEVLESAIFGATLQQLVTDGYARLTMEGVAAAAQTGKAALYRRWSSKEELVKDA